jgi:hypothetical protein
MKYRASTGRAQRSHIDVTADWFRETDPSVHVTSDAPTSFARSHLFSMNKRRHRIILTRDGVSKTDELRVSTFPSEI